MHFFGRETRAIAIPIFVCALNLQIFNKIKPYEGQATAMPHGISTENAHDMLYG